MRPKRGHQKGEGGLGEGWTRRDITWPLYLSARFLPIFLCLVEAWPLNGYENYYRRGLSAFYHRRLFIDTRWIKRRTLSFYETANLSACSGQKKPVANVSLVGERIYMKSAKAKATRRTNI